MKIVILILLHEYSEQQKKLVDYLSTYFDIYIHIDKRTTISVDSFSGDNIFVFKKYKVYWGSYNQILATLFLFKEANKNQYDRYVFISGTDIPLKTGKEINNFFMYNNKEYFVNFELPACWYDRIDFYYSNTLGFDRVTLLEKFTKKIFDKMNNYIIPFSQKYKLHRSHMNIRFYAGANWMNLTNNCVNQIIAFIKNNDSFLRRFKFTRCADEIFFQTIIHNYVRNVEIVNDCLRYVEWETGSDHPRILRLEDYDKIKNTHCLFARKFDYTVDNAIIDKLYADIRNN